MTDDRLKVITDRFKDKKIAVIGDLMVDRYFWGSVSRISPEAPVPVVDIDSESTRLGGAANVANNIYSLGGFPLIMGVVGDDNSAELLIDKLFKRKLPTDGIIKDPSRKTTVKTRIIADNQHLVRADQETTQDIGRYVVDNILSVLNDHIEEVDSIILEDYNKGLLVSELIGGIINIATQNNKVITVDPKFDHFFDYQQVTVFKPNRRETERILGLQLNGSANVKTAGLQLQKRLNCENVLITLGEDGMTLFEPGGEVYNLQNKAIEVHDVSGAGDTVISAMTMALAGGADVKEAAIIANYAAGVVCGKVGVQPIELEELVESVQYHRKEGQSTHG